jgi:hypothetical protein
MERHPTGDFTDNRCGPIHNSQPPVAFLSSDFSSLADIVNWISITILMEVKKGVNPNFLAMEITAWHCDVTL